MKRFHPLLLGPAAAVVLLGIPRVLLFNYSPSLPIGVYLVSSNPPLHGSFVALCLPSDLAAHALIRGYTRRGNCPSGTTPLLKLVAAVAGDLVTTRPAGIAINGTLLPHSARRSTDRRNLPLEVSPFSGAVPPGSVWLFAPHPDSWDSRYFGPVPLSSVRSTLKPLLVWPTP